jgi:hypothetical protein
MIRLFFKMPRQIIRKSQSNIFRKSFTKPSRKKKTEKKGSYLAVAQQGASGSEPRLKLLQQVMQMGTQQQRTVLVGSGRVVFGVLLFFGGAFRDAFVVLEHFFVVVHEVFDEDQTRKRTLSVNRSIHGATKTKQTKKRKNSPRKRLNFISQ